MGLKTCLELLWVGEGMRFRGTRREGALSYWGRIWSRAGKHEECARQVSEERKFQVGETAEVGIGEGRPRTQLAKPRVNCSWLSNGRWKANNTKSFYL